MDVEVLVDYDELKARVWYFTDLFHGKDDFGLGDARAYVSALADILVAEQGYEYTLALAHALEHAMGVYKSAGLSGVKDDARRVIEKWREIDRSALSRAKLPRGLSGVPYGDLGGDRTGNYTVVSLFTGAYGLDLGFELAGFNIALALDISEDSYINLKANRPKMPFLLGDIKRFTTHDILREAGLKPGEVDVLTGGPPCQPFSPAGKRLSFGDPRAAPLMEFIRVIREARPKVFVMEEVPGLLNARIRHVPIRERGKRPLAPEEVPGSAWAVVLEELGKTGYRIAWKVLNAADYGTPQLRERVIIIGVRPDLRRNPVLPAPGYSRTRGLLAGKPWLTLLEAIADVTEDVGYSEVPPKYARFIRYIPPGGNWRQLPGGLVREAMNGAYDAGGGRTGFYRRLTWFEPAPTLVTSPAMKATMLVHPWEDRPLSVREYLRIQGFPDTWKVVVPVERAYRLFGEAVPVPLAYAVAKVIRQVILRGD